MLALMLPSVLLIPGALSDLFASASTTGCMTLADRYGLLAALLDDNLGDEERCCIDRLLHATRRGRIKLVDDISALN
jgi:hypothetical protein